MRTVKIITDSASDLPAQYFEKYDVAMLPMGVVVGDKTYLDRVELCSKDFFDMMKRDPDLLPKTVMPSAEAMTQEFRKNLETFSHQIFVSISSKGSGTYDVARMVKESIEDELGRPSNITLVDSYSFSAGYGIIVAEMAKLAYEGAGFDAVMAKYHEMKDSVKVLLVVDDLKHLQRGGRIKASVALIGGMLGIKPILTIKDGLIDSFGKERGKRRAMERMLETLLADVKTPEKTRVWLIQADAQEDMQFLKQMVTDRMTPLEIVECEMGACVGSHAGGGLVGLVYTVEG